MRGHLEPGSGGDEIANLVCGLLISPLGRGAEVLSRKLLLDKYPDLVYDMNVFDVLEPLNLSAPSMKGIAPQYAAWQAWFEGSPDYDEEPEERWPDLRRSADDVTEEIRGRPETTGRIWVDLAAPDELIVKSFSTWLKAKRERMGLKRAQLVVDTAEMQRWTTFQILPFLDIELFAMMAGHDVTAAVAGDLLFPLEEVDSAERIRKVVKPLAEKIMSGVFIEALGRQAALSRPEGESIL